MGLAFLRHDIFQLHRTPELHPENPERLTAIDRAIADSDLQSRIVSVMPRLATPNELCAVHSADYVGELERSADRAKEQGKFVQLDADTFMSEASFDAAKLAAGAGLIAVESVKTGGFSGSFVAVRPPGHHARISRQMGFCIINNIALAARYARNQLGYKRVLIIDWDVHHGNGTQEIFYDDPSVCFISLHQFPFWPPNSGWFTEDGKGEGKGYSVNIPLPGGTGDRGYLLAWDKVALPVALEYKPELILVSAGYDAHQLDPLGQQQITTVGFAMLSQRLFELSQMTGAKVVGFLEGGYNKRALSESVVATLRFLSADSPQRLTEVHDSYQAPGLPVGLEMVTGDRNPDQVNEHIESVSRHYAQYWHCLRSSA
jgi:acetoin utilization deacetylase AcuC-like enzyme